MASEDRLALPSHGYQRLAVAPGHPQRDRAESVYFSAKVEACAGRIHAQCRRTVTVSLLRVFCDGAEVSA